MPEAKLDLETCHRELTAGFKQLGRERRELQADIQSIEEERARVEAAITRAHERLEQLHTSLEELAQERDSHDEAGRSMEAEHSSLADAAGELLGKLIVDKSRLPGLGL